jgi:hypothetical protein
MCVASAVRRKYTGGRSSASSRKPPPNDRCYEPELDEPEEPDVDEPLDELGVLLLVEDVVVELSVVDDVPGEEAGFPPSPEDFPPSPEGFPPSPEGFLA